MEELERPEQEDNAAQIHGGSGEYFEMFFEQVPLDEEGNILELTERKKDGSLSKLNAIKAEITGSGTIKNKFLIQHRLRIDPGVGR